MSTSQLCLRRFPLLLKSERGMTSAAYSLPLVWLDAIIILELPVGWWEGEGQFAIRPTHSSIETEMLQYPDLLQ